MDKRYRALRIISTFYKIAGGVVLAFTLLSAAGICLAGVLGGGVIENLSRDLGDMGGMNGMGLMSSTLGGLIAAFVVFIGGAVSGLTLYATGEGIALLIAMEENTRATAQYLAQQQRPTAPVVPPPGAD
jgi:hypothetical protein